MELQDCIVFLLAKTSQAGYRVWGKYISDLNVTPVQAMILILLNRDDGCSSRDIGKQVQLDSATLTGILDRLEGMSLIKRLKNPEDRRGILVNLTVEGKKSAARLDELFDEAHSQFLESFSEEEENTFRSLLKRLQSDHAVIK